MAWVTEFALRIADAPTSPGRACYRPPCWPPPPDWVVSEDEQGQPVSRWGEPTWSFTYMAGKTLVLNFAGGRHAKVPALGSENQNLLRLTTTWLIWKQRGVKSWGTVKNEFTLIRKLFVLCEDEGIPANQLWRYPTLLSRLCDLYSSKNAKRTVLVILDRILRDKDGLGFILLDESSLLHLSKAIKKHDNDVIEQTAYIPPRIWTHVVGRLRECLDDFLAHSQKVQKCYYFCLDAYAHNFGSLAEAMTQFTKSDSYLPFAKQRPGAGNINGKKYYGAFEAVARNFGIDELLRKWIACSDSEQFGIAIFSKYLHLIQYAGLAYISCFTLQRKDECGALRSDCLIWEDDPVLGQLAVIRGETTKTDPDSDARWPTSPSVEFAVSALTVVAEMRMKCAASNPRVRCTDYDKANPYLFNFSFEPWSSSFQTGPYSTRPTLRGLRNEVVENHPKLFDDDVLRIKEDDLKIARMFTPNLNKKGQFKVGNIWPLAWHQLRRTGAVNMFASDLLDDSSIQVIMKHRTLLQTRYYGRNFSRIRFSHEYENLTISARYEVMARQYEALVESRYVSPSGEQRKDEIVVRTLSIKNFKSLIEAGRKGEISFRATRLGGCAKRGPCEYGGIESVARCAGGDGQKPCLEAIFDKAKREAAERQLDIVERRMKETQPNSPRWRALEAEAIGLRSYLDAVSE